MERYTISVGAIRLIVPFSPTSTVQVLANEVRRRASRLAVVLPEAITLHLGDENGPLLDVDDSLQDVVLDSVTEFITVVAQDDASGGVAGPVLAKVSVATWAEFCSG